MTFDWYDMAHTAQAVTTPADVITPAFAGQDEKADIKHFDEVTDGTDNEVIMKSPFEDLPWRKTWVVYRKVAMVCLFASFSAAAE